MKVICAGAPKTGTKSMTRALRILGYNEVFDVEEAMEFAFDEWEKVFDGTKTDVNDVIRNVYSNGIDAVVDMPHSSFFDHFLEEWPDAKVILTLRSTEDWFHSYKTMVDKADRDYFFMNFFVPFSPTTKRLRKWCYGLSWTSTGSVKPREVLWKTWYKRHNSFVRNTVPPSQLLEFNVQEGWGPLCKFLGKEIPNLPFPWENQAHCPHNITDRMLQDTWIAKKSKKEIIFVMLCFFILLISAFVLMIWRLT